MGQESRSPYLTGNCMVLQYELDFRHMLYFRK